MNITLEDIKKITLGSLDIFKEDDYFVFLRFSKKHMDYLIKRGENVFKRAVCTANIKLEFFTNGGEISFDYEILKGTPREYYSIDLLIDGVHKYSVSDFKNEDTGTFRFSAPLSKKQKRITIYFPSTACLKLKNLIVPDDFKPSSRNTNILTLGDSLLQGYNPDHFQNTCMNIVADYFDADMINQAIGGDCFFKGNIEKIPFTPDFILVSYGLNDWVSGNFKNGEDCEEYLDTLSDFYPKTPVFLILPPQIEYLEKTGRNDDLLFDAQDKATVTMDDVRFIISEKAKKHKNIAIIDAKYYIPQNPECFYRDNVHLTDYGNRIYGDKIAKAIDTFEERMI